MGYATGIVDFTRGELGTRGTPEQRLDEAAAAAKIMGVSFRENLDFEDGWFENDRDHQIAVIRKIRKYRPEIVLATAIYDRHPDHGRAARVMNEALFKSGLEKIHTIDEDGNPQLPWRPKKTYHYIQSVSLEPDFLVDVSEHHSIKMEAVRAYKSQFYDPNSDEPETYISTPEFMNMLEARSAEYGHRIGVKYAEGFIQHQFLGVKNLFDLV
ncbi:bshB1 [Symbiodinium microadriaticum]|nr:bshB1 [Symbiodinium microadriaticum]